jgi:hypothetical protein
MKRGLSSEYKSHVHQHGKNYCKFLGRKEVAINKKHSKSANKIEDSIVFLYQS